MKKLLATVLIAAAALLAGCAGTSAIVQSEYRLAPGERLKLQVNTHKDVTEEGMAIMRDRLTSQLTASSLLATGTDAQARTLEVSITNYYMRHGATRALVGIMAGSDNIQSTVRLKDAAGKMLSEFTVESKNPTAWGSSRGLIEEHADKIISTLRGIK